jgi:hypothetical protein
MKDLFLQDLIINKEHFSNNGGDYSSSDEEYSSSDEECDTIYNKNSTDDKKYRSYEYDKKWYIFFILLLVIICLFLFLFYKI